MRVCKTKSLLFCLRYAPPIVFRGQNHKTVIFIKMMSHDLLVQMAYPTDLRSLLSLATSGSLDIQVNNDTRNCFPPEVPERATLQKL